MSARDQDGTFTPQELAQIDCKSKTNLRKRLPRAARQVASLIGAESLAFDNDTNWHFDHTTMPPTPMPPTPAKSDFYSVALHEIGHTLGFGASSEWTSFVSGTTFIGPQSMANIRRVGAARIGCSTKLIGRMARPARSSTARPTRRF